MAVTMLFSISLRIVLLLLLLLRWGYADSNPPLQKQQPLLQACYNGQLGKYHVNASCNRAQHNAFRNSLNRYSIYKEVESVGPNQIPPQKTIICPNQEEDSTAANDLTQEPIKLEGFPTVWLVENKASTPVVVGLINPIDGMEYSGQSEKIRPPHRDPRAILQPGTWKVFFTFEGKVYNIRSLLDDGQTLGPVLLQHRVGIIPIKNNYGPENILDYCPSRFEPDLPPSLPENPTQPDPEYKRDPVNLGRPCNIVDVGIRNDVGCPLHVYWTGTEAPNATSGKPTCREDFKFHLGLNKQPKDFIWDWDSPFEWFGTYVGHYFTVRLAEDPSILVDTISLDPAIVGDCPTNKKQTITTRTDVSPLGILHTLPTMKKNASNTTTIHAGPPLSLNYTQSKQFQKFLHSMNTF